MSNSSLNLKVLYLYSLYFLFKKKLKIKLQFELNIKESNEEGLYILSFINCFQPQYSKNKFSKSDLNLKQNPSDLETAVSSLFSFDEFKYGINLEVKS